METRIHNTTPPKQAGDITRHDLTRARWAARVGAALLIATALIPTAPNDLRGVALVWAGAFVLVAVACGSELRHLTRKEANRGYHPRHRR